LTERAEARAATQVRAVRAAVVVTGAPVNVTLAAP
jgi:hypothetical protein